MIADMFKSVFRDGSREASALQAAGLLSALVFLGNYSFEMLAIQGLYSAQYVLIGVLLCTLATWAIVEVAIIQRKQTSMPLNALTLMLWVQLAVVVVRHVPLFIGPDGEAVYTAGAGNLHFGIAAVFGPIYMVVLLVLTKLLINAFSYAEFLRANQLAEQMVINQRAQAQLRRSEESYRLIAERVGDVIWTMTDTARISYASPSVESLLEFTPEEVISQPVSAVVAPDSLAAAEKVVSTALSRVRAGLPLSLVRGELELRRKDQSTVWTETSLNALHDSGGRVIGLVCVTRDITERKQLEATLVEARDAAVAANLSKSRFLNTMSHDIRTPMTAVLGVAQLLGEPDITEAERVNYAGIVVDAASSLMTTINGILDLSKIEADKVQLERIALDPALILAQTSALFTATARAKGLEIQSGWHGDSHTPYLGDPHRVTQMLSNLVNNALKFTPSGLIRIEALEFERSESGAVLEFSVSDNGIGIAEDKLNLLFQEFSQVSTTTTRNYGGTGLGLSIVRSLAELMGGTVGVESKVGQGSRFWFRIQVGQAAT